MSPLLCPAELRAHRCASKTFYPHSRAKSSRSPLSATRTGSPFCKAVTEGPELPDNGTPPSVLTSPEPYARPAPPAFFVEIAPLKCILLAGNHA